ncbi:unnamed protein product, partial [Nesidiocoris tenuis]
MSSDAGINKIVPAGLNGSTSVQSPNPTTGQTSSSSEATKPSVCRPKSSKSPSVKQRNSGDPKIGTISGSNPSAVMQKKGIAPKGAAVFHGARRSVEGTFRKIVNFSKIRRSIRTWRPLRANSRGSRLGSSQVLRSTMENLEADLYNATISELRPKRDPLYIVVPMTILYSFIFVTGLVGNISTCIVISRNRHMHTATNYYLFSLAISDLLLLVSGLPQEMYYIWS